MSLNKKSRFLALMVGGLTLLALIMQDGKLLLLTMPFLAYLLIGVIQAPSDLALTINRVIDPPGVVPAELVETKLTINNLGESLINLSLNDPGFPSITIVEGQHHQRLSLSARETTELKYVFRPERGVYTWKSVQAVASDSFELFELRKEIPAPGELIVKPAAFKLDRISVQPRMTLHTPGPISIRLPGSSTNFLGIREYRPGDSLRRLNWRLAARHPHELFTNEYEREEIADFGLILDARKLTNMDGIDEKLFECSVSGTQSLSRTLLHQGNRVALLVFGEHMVSLLPGYGKRQLNRIERSLASAKLGSKLPLGFLEYFPTRLFPSRSLLIVFSTVSVSDHETYARLRSYGYDILLISPDPIAWISQTIGSTPINQLAVRAARVERIVQLKRLMKLGIHVIDWQVNASLEAVVREAAARFAHRRRM